MNDKQKDDFYNDIYNAISGVCYNLYVKEGIYVNKDDFDEIIGNFKKHFFEEDK